MSVICPYRKFEIAFIDAIVSRASMFSIKRRERLRLTKKSLDRISTKWKLAIAGMIGSGLGLLILTMWRPCYYENESFSIESSKLTPVVPSVGRTNDVRFYKEEKSFTYCFIQSCKIVTCSSIPESLDSGQVASDFITETFKVTCPKVNAIEQLNFQSCSFSNNTLKRNWLKANYSIELLSFIDCSIEDFSNGSFASTIYKNLKTLHVTTGRIRVLHKWTFDELTNLKTFQMEDTTIHEADNDLLTSVADSLEILVLNGCLKNVTVFANMMSSSSLEKVQILSIQRNSIGKISSKLFNSIPNVVSLYLGKSKIDYMDRDSLNNLRTLKLIDITGNSLRTLPAGVFASVLIREPNFKISMTQNPWNCDCELNWIRSMMNDYPYALTDIPKCESPANNAFLYFTNAQFCDNTTEGTVSEQSTTITTTMKQLVTEENEENSSNYVKFNCQNYELSSISPIRRKLFSTDEWEFPSRHKNFSLNPLDNGEVLVNLKINDNLPSVIWFPNSKMAESSGARSSGAINCVKNVRGSFRLTNLTSETSYTICLLDDMKKLLTPLNCLATTTRTIYESNDDTWLTKSDRSIVISSVVTLFIIMCLVAIFTSFWIIRRNPCLLSGSKRIVMVRKRGVDALVMPRGTKIKSSERRHFYNENTVSKNNGPKKTSEPAYMTPIQHHKLIDFTVERKNSSPREPPRRKDSKVSRVSSHYSAPSYVSLIEATPSELYNWRANRRARSCATCIENDEFEEPPPTPPLPLSHRSYDRSIPSLSLAIETNKGQQDMAVYFNDRANRSSRKLDRL